jgi:hypothetical protein
MDIPASTFAIADYFHSISHVKLFLSPSRCLSDTSNIEYLHFAHMSYGSENKQPLFTVYINRLVFRMVTLSTGRRSNWITMDNNPLLTLTLSHARLAALF